MRIVTKSENIPLAYDKLGLIPGSNTARYDAMILESTVEAPIHPCIVVCPGGGYNKLADREAEHIALEFAAKGFSTFILRYSVSASRFPCALVELSWMMQHIRNHAEEYQIDSNQIGVIGFSAGAHLAASLGAYWNDPKIQDILNIKNNENKPNGLILSYPVITGGEHAHKGSFIHLFGEDATEEQMDVFSIEKHVTESFPKTFIWHTTTDKTVPVENSLMLAMALSQAKVPFEMRVYPYGPHGLALCNHRTAEGRPELIVPRASQWINDAISFLTDIAFCD